MAEGSTHRQPSSATSDDSIRDPEIQYSPNPHRVQQLVSLIVFVISLAVLWWNAAPSVTFHDSGEFAMAAASAGIPHPPGAPTWTALASAFVRIGGFQDPARGTNLFCGLCGALTVALLCYLVQLWTFHLFPAQPRWLSPLAGVTSALVLMHSPAFLEQSTTTEQYTLLTAIVAAMLIVASNMMLRTRAKASGANVARPGIGLAVLLGLLCGLAVGNHLSQVPLVLFVLWAIWAASSKENRWHDVMRMSAGAGLGLILGLMVFLWLPIRSFANPLMDWGDVESWDRFMWAIGRKLWKTRPLSEAPPGFALEWLQSYDLLGQMGVLGFALTGIGLLVLARKNRVWLGWLAAVSIPYTIGMLVAHLRQEGMTPSYICSYGVVDWHLPVYLVAAASAGVATAWVACSAYRRWTIRTGAPVALGALAVLTFTTCMSVRDSSLRNFSAPKEFMQAVLSPIPKGSLVVVSADNLNNVLCYQAYSGEEKIDYRVLYGSMSGGLIGRRQSSAVFTEAEKVHYLTKAILSPDVQPLKLPPMSAREARKVRIFTDYWNDYYQDLPYLLPAGLLFEFKSRPVTAQEVRDAERRWRAEYPDLIKEPRPGSHRLERDAWAKIHQQRGAFFQARGLWPEAADAYARSLEWVPNDGEIWFCLAYAEERMGKSKEAMQAYESALEFAPYLRGPRANLGVLYALAGRLEEAERLLERELLLDSKNKAVRHNLALVRKEMAEQGAGSAARLN